MCVKNFEPGKMNAEVRVICAALGVNFAEVRVICAQGRVIGEGICERARGAAKEVAREITSLC